MFHAHRLVDDFRIWLEVHFCISLTCARVRGWLFFLNCNLNVHPLKQFGLSELTKRWWVEQKAEKSNRNPNCNSDIFDLFTYFPIDLHLHWTCFAWLSCFFLLFEFEFFLRFNFLRKFCCISVWSVFELCRRLRSRNEFLLFALQTFPRGFFLETFFPSSIFKLFRRLPTTFV